MGVSRKVGLEISNSMEMNTIKEKCGHQLQNVKNRDHKN
jgi:hypothetical protein